jgi:hypothetical protein
MNSISEAMKHISKKKKVGFSLKIPFDLKEEFQIICDENDVAMNQLIVGLIKEAVQDYKKVKEEQ